MKPINEIPEFKTVADNETNIQTELQRNDKRGEEIHAEFSKPLKASSENAFETYLTTGGAYAADPKTELREELQWIDSRQEFLRTALDQCRQKLDKIRGQLSLEACKEMRPKYVAAIRRLLAGLKQVCEANDEIMAVHDEIQRNGYRSGSLAAGNFTAVDVWESPYGSNVQGYRNYVGEHFPELKTK